ncbi:MAG: AlpA family phage regulatory protein [Deltaproteobacteria bacterium]|nr:AlpA family phage regulatory protein [Deltaproteobacteria bacterium]
MSWSYAYMRRTTLSRTMIYELVSRGEFPAQVHLGGRVSGWLNTEVTQWILDRASERPRRMAA